MPCSQTTVSPSSSVSVNSAIILVRGDSVVVVLVVVVVVVVVVTSVVVVVVVAVACTPVVVVASSITAILGLNSFRALTGSFGFASSQGSKSPQL